MSSITQPLCFAMLSRLCLNGNAGYRLPLTNRLCDTGGAGHIQAGIWSFQLWMAIYGENHWSYIKWFVSTIPSCMFPQNHQNIIESYINVCADRKLIPHKICIATAERHRAHRMNYVHLSHQLVFISVNTLGQRQNGRHLADGIFQSISVVETCVVLASPCISTPTSLQYSIYSFFSNETLKTRIPNYRTTQVCYLCFFFIRAACILNGIYFITNERWVLYKSCQCKGEPRSPPVDKLLPYKWPYSPTSPTPHPTPPSPPTPSHPTHHTTTTPNPTKTQNHHHQIPPTPPPPPNPTQPPTHPTHPHPPTINGSYSEMVLM